MKPFRRLSGLPVLRHPKAAASDSRVHTDRAQIIRRWEDSSSINPAFFRFTRLLTAILFLSHLVACFWFGMYQFNDGIAPFDPTAAHSNWVHYYASEQPTEDTS